MALYSRHLECVTNCESYKKKTASFPLEHVLRRRKVEGSEVESCSERNTRSGGPRRFLPARGNVRYRLRFNRVRIPPCGPDCFSECPWRAHDKNQIHDCGALGDLLSDCIS